MPWRFALAAGPTAPTDKSYVINIAQTPIGGSLQSIRPSVQTTVGSDKEFRVVVTDVARLRSRTTETDEMETDEMTCTHATATRRL
jgi:hypothetical protein